MRDVWEIRTYVIKSDAEVQSWLKFVKGTKNGIYSFSFLGGNPDLSGSCVEIRIAGFADNWVLNISVEAS